MADIRIRPASPNDAERLTDIAKRAKAHWGYSQDLLDIWSDELTVLPADCDGESVWLLEADDKITGFGKLIVEGDSAELTDLWIDPDHMGRGYGKSLFQHVCQLAASLGANHLLLEADPFAVGFYERMGATTIGKVDSTQIPGRSLPLMKVVLPGPGNTTI